MREKLRSIYAELYVKGSHRARFTPRVARPWRPKVIAWAGPMAFYPNRFYERDKWYKARITKPEIVPKMHIIDPNDYTATLEERTKEAQTHITNIGYKEKEDPELKKEHSTEEMERLSRKLQLKIDLKRISHTQLPLFHHYRIFDDLFGEGVFFHITQKMDVSYGPNGIYQGNILTAADTAEKPQIDLEPLGQGYNTVVMVNMDGDPYKASGGEIVHWIVSNVADGQPVNSGSQNIPYLQVLPFRGTGYHRIAFVLFRHKQPCDLLSYSLKKLDLESRQFCMRRFYKENEEVLTPSSISFFQASWDMSVNNAIHNLGLEVPIYEYEYSRPLKMKQKEFPNKPMPFDLYLDQFRDPKEVDEEILKKRLSLSTVKEPAKQPKYPDIWYVENKRRLPYWMHSRLIRENSGEGRYYGLWNNPIDR